MLLPLLLVVDGMLSDASPPLEGEIAGGEDGSLISDRDVFGSSKRVAIIEQYLADGFVPIEDRSRLIRIEKEVHKKLLEFRNKQDFIMDTYREVTRELEHIFDEIYTINEENRIIPVKRIYANPERSVAKQIQEDNLILPIISIDQQVSQTSSERSRYNPVLVHDVIWSDRYQRAVRLLSLSPAPVNLTYNISLWAKYGEDLDQILEQISLMFNPSLNIPTKHSSETQAFIVEEEDNTDVIYDDGKDRMVKRIITVNVETYIRNPQVVMTSSGKMQDETNITFEINT